MKAAVKFDELEAATKQLAYHATDLGFSHQFLFQSYKDFLRPSYGLGRKIDPSEEFWGNLERTARAWIVNSTTARQFSIFFPIRRNENTGSSGDVIERASQPAIRKVAETELREFVELANRQDLTDCIPRLALDGSEFVHVRLNDRDVFRAIDIAMNAIEDMRNDMRSIGSRYKPKRPVSVDYGLAFAVDNEQKPNSQEYLVLRDDSRKLITEAAERLRERASGKYLVSRGYYYQFLLPRKFNKAQSTVLGDLRDHQEMLKEFWRFYTDARAALEDNRPFQAAESLASGLRFAFFDIDSSNFTHPFDDSEAGLAGGTFLVECGGSVLAFSALRDAFAHISEYINYDYHRPKHRKSLIPRELRQRKLDIVDMICGESWPDICGQESSDELLKYRRDLILATDSVRRLVSEQYDLGRNLVEVFANRQGSLPRDSASLDSSYFVIFFMLHFFRVLLDIRIVLYDKEVSFQNFIARLIELRRSIVDRETTMVDTKFITRFLKEGWPFILDTDIDTVKGKR